MAFFQQQDNIYKRETNINDEDLTSVFYTLSGQEDDLVEDKPINKKPNNTTRVLKLPSRVITHGSEL